jgi:hypothetical protein
MRELQSKAEILEKDPGEFKKGDFVKWKRGMKNKRLPEKNQVAIVMEVRPKGSLANKDDSGSCSYREPIDLKLGLIDRDGDFSEYHFDSRRFEKVTDLE